MTRAASQTSRFQKVRRPHLPNYLYYIASLRKGPEDAPQFAHAHVVEKYLEDYTDHFNLRHLLRLSTTVKKISPLGKTGNWAITLESGEVEYFDKVVTATGINQVPVIPDIPGLEKFEGRYLHSRAYKR